MYKKQDVDITLPYTQLELSQITIKIQGQARLSVSK